VPSSRSRERVFDQRAKCCDQLDWLNGVGREGVERKARRGRCKVFLYRRTSTSLDGAIVEIHGVGLRPAFS
jgi:hypothetical protein